MYQPSVDGPIKGKRSKKLLRSYSQKKFFLILFTDSKIFTLGDKYNMYNYRVYARSSLEVKEKVPWFQRGYYPIQVMVWWGVS